MAKRNHTVSQTFAGRCPEYVELRSVITSLKGAVSTSVPEEFTNHSLVRKQFFFTLPPRLVELVERHVGKPVLEESLRPLESTLGQICGQHRWEIGYWNDQILLHQDLVEPEPIPMANGEASKSLKVRLNAIKTNATRKLGNRRISWLHKMSRGYAGWLVTNPQFLDEQDRLLRKWKSQIRRWGLAGRGRVLVGRPPTALEAVETCRFGDLRAFDEGLITFLTRWQLEELSAPDMPVPLKPFLSGQFPIQNIEQRMRGGGVFQLPEIYPLPARDEFRNILSDAHTGRVGTEHLAEWQSIIRLRNTAKNQIDRYARIRTLVHFWRVLHLRHAVQLNRRRGKLQQAFAEYLGTRAHSIKKDLQFVTRRMGPDWVLRDACAFLRR